MTSSKISFLIGMLFAFVPKGLAQLANAYPHDIGLETDPDVLYMETFEDGMPNILSRYSDKKNTAGMSLDTDVPPMSAGQYSLKMTNLGGSNNGGHLYRQFTPGWDSTVYVRYYVKYPATSQGFIHHEAVWFGGYNPATPWPNPQAGTCGLGDNRISVAYEPVSATTMNTYLYWGDMRNDPNGNCWGNVMIKGDWDAPAIPYDEWMCVELMLKLNDPVTATNGELRIWQNGEEVGYWGPGFPNGNWVWDKFIVNPADPPFPGFRWRTDPNLNINYLWIEFYDDQSPNGVSHYIKYDHLVVAKKPIGPISNVTDSGDLPATKPAIRIYPNPAADFLTFALTDDVPNAMVCVFDLLGKQVLSAPVSAPSTTLDVSKLSAGLYFVEVRVWDSKDRGKVLRKEVFLH